MGADKSAKNTRVSEYKIYPKCPPNFGPFCLPKPKSFEFLKKSSVWVSVVREQKYQTKKSSCLSLPLILYLVLQIIIYY